MDKAQLKKRIVGAIVLVALGVIFIPMILNQGDDATTITGTNIPPKPESLQQLAKQPMPAPPAAPDVETNKPQLVDEFTPPVEQIDGSITESKIRKQTETAPKEEVKSESTAKSEQEAKPESKPTVSETKPKETTPTKKQRGWVVQVASFSERAKALKLRDRLRAKKYPTFVESVKAKSGIRYRVRVGPEVKKERAERLKKKIAKEFRIKDALVMSLP